MPARALWPSRDSKAAERRFRHPTRTATPKGGMRGTRRSWVSRPPTAEPTASKMYTFPTPLRESPYLSESILHPKANPNPPRIHSGASMPNAAEATGAMPVSSPGGMPRSSLTVLARKSSEGRTAHTPIWSRARALSLSSIPSANLPRPQLPTAPQINHAESITPKESSLP